MKKMNHDEWAEHLPGGDLGPGKTYGSLWGVPFFVSNGEPDFLTEAEGEDDPVALEAIKAIDLADRWDEWYERAGELCKMALSKEEA